MRGLPGTSHFQPPSEAFDAYLDSLSDSSRRTVKTDLTHLAELISLGDPRYVSWHDLDDDQLSRIKRELARLVEQDELARSTAKKRLSALRGVLRTAAELDLMTEDRLKATFDIIGRFKAEPPSSRLVTGSEAHQFLRSCLFDLEGAGIRNQSFRDRRKQERLAGTYLRGLRDAAIFALAYAYGLKSKEVRELTSSSIKENGTVLRVSGRGERELPLLGWVKTVTTLWRAHRLDEEHLFYGMSKFGEPFQVHKRLSDKRLRSIIHERIYTPSSERITFEDLRQTCRERLKRAGVRETVRRALLGLHLRAAPPEDDELCEALRLIETPIDMTEFVRLARAIPTA